MTTYFIYGAEISPKTPKNHDIQVYGDGKHNLDCTQINLPENAHVVINAHGSVNFLGHSSTLCNFDDDITSQNQPYLGLLSKPLHKPRANIMINGKDYYTTGELFKIISNNKAINIEFFSCHGGAAIDAINFLPKSSTLITFVSPENKELSHISEEILDKIFALKNFEHSFSGFWSNPFSSSPKYLDNSFIKYASYLFINPQSTSFAIKLSDNQSKSFSTSIKLLIESAQHSSDVRQWQNQQLDRFVAFCKEIQDKVDKNNFAQIEQLLNIIQDNQRKDHWLNQFDIDRFKEMLLINMSANNELGLDIFLNNTDVNINAKAINSMTALSVAAQCNYADMVNILLKNGADVDLKDGNGSTSLHRAVFNEHANATKSLLKNGADINVKVEARFFNQYDSYSQSIENELPENGQTALDIAYSKGNLEIIKLLLTYGAKVESWTIKTNSFIENIKSFIFKQDKPAIFKEIDLYEKSPLSYILKAHNRPSDVLIALKNLKLHGWSLWSTVQKIEDCLKAQPEGIITNLSSICGEDGTYYTQLESEL